MGAIAQVTRHRELFDQDGNKVVEATVTFTGTYATGGDTLSPALFGMTEVRELWQSGGAFATSAYNHAVPGSGATTQGQLVLAGTGVAPLVQVWSGGTQVANATSLTTRQHRIRLVGR